MTSWALTAPAFDRLLAALDRDRDAAARTYETIRQRLIKFFTWRGCDDPLTCADQTIDRVARRLDEGAAITAADPYVFFYGVAVNVLKEQWRAPERTASIALTGASEPRIEPADERVRHEQRADRERQLGCLDRCLDRLPAESRALFVRYFVGERLIDARRELAATLGIPMNALRIRVFRLRQTVERCVGACLGARP